MLVMSARSVATTEHFQQFMYSTVSKPEDGASCREQVVLLLLLLFFLSSHEIKHWEFILQDGTVVFEGKHCEELHCVLANKPTG